MGLLQRHQVDEIDRTINENGDINQTQVETRFDFKMAAVGTVNWNGQRCGDFPFSVYFDILIFLFFVWLLLVLLSDGSSCFLHLFFVRPKTFLRFSSFYFFFWPLLSWSNKTTRVHIHTKTYKRPFKHLGNWIIRMKLNSVTFHRLTLTCFRVIAVVNEANYAVVDIRRPFLGIKNVLIEIILI